MVYERSPHGKGPLTGSGLLLSEMGFSGPRHTVRAPTSQPERAWARPEPVFRAGTQSALFLRDHHLSGFSGLRSSIILRAPMQITIEDISPVEKRVDFELPWTDVAPRLDRKYNDLRRKVKLDGFRPGKAPRPVLEKLYKHSVEDDVARELVEVSIVQAIREKQLEPVAPPSVDRIDLREGQPFKFTARVEVRSQVDPKDYSGIPVERRATKVAEEEGDRGAGAVPEAADQLHAGRRPRAVAAERHVDGRGAGQGRRTQGQTRKCGIDLSDDAGGPLPGLASRLRGLAITPGSKHEVKYTIGDDAKPAELAGKEVSLSITIKEARERKTPAIDDELAKDTGEAETLEELKNKVRERLLDADKKRVKTEVEQALVKELVKRNPFPIAPALVDRFADGIVERGRMQLQMMGVDAKSLDTERMKAEFKDEAEVEARSQRASAGHRRSRRHRGHRRRHAKAHRRAGGCSPDQRQEAAGRAGTERTDECPARSDPRGEDA